MTHKDMQPYCEIQTQCETQPYCETEEALGSKPKLNFPILIDDSEPTRYHSDAHKERRAKDKDFWDRWERSYEAATEQVGESDGLKITCFCSSIFTLEHTGLPEFAGNQLRILPETMVMMLAHMIKTQRAWFNRIVERAEAKAAESIEAEAMEAGHDGK